MDSSTGDTPHTLHGTIRAKWQQLGGETGYLGYPITNEMPTPSWLQPHGDVVQFFQGGTLIWKASNNTATTGEWSDYIPLSDPVLDDELLFPQEDAQNAPAPVPNGGTTQAPASGSPQLTVTPAARTSCPPGTDHGDDSIYTCITQFEDVQGNTNVLRRGRAHNVGRGGFGQGHYKNDHHVEDRAVELLVQDSAPQQISPKGTRYRYAKVFKVNGNNVIAFQVITNWAPLSGGPDTQQFGIVTAYCSDPNNNDNFIQYCPDIMPPYNLKTGQ